MSNNTNTGSEKILVDYKVLDQLLKKQSRELMKEILFKLRQKGKLTDLDIKDVFKEEDILVDINIFSNKLSPAEAIVKHLFENYDLNYHKIGILLNRDERGIWSTYSRANKKQKKFIKVKETKYLIPLDEFSDRTLSILETTVYYSIKNFMLTIAQIAKLLNKDPSTVWTVFNRAKLKIKIKKGE